MDVSYHYTHWDVREDLADHARDIVGRFGGSWNSYFDHPPGMGLDETSVDWWDGAGRGAALPESTGDEIVAWLLGQHVLIPIRWLIWFGWIWTPEAGWLPYAGWQGSHHDHVHVTFL